jgi:hypothetical protein
MNMRRKARRSKPKIFLSYAEEDQRLAAQIKQILTKATDRSVVIGPSLVKRKTLSSGIRREFEDSDLYVLVLTTHLLDSDRAQAEVGAAWALEKPTMVVVSDLERDLQVPLLADLEVARVSVDELQRSGVAEGILHRAGHDGDRVT